MILKPQLHKIIYRLFRSLGELEFARFCNSKAIEWQYEPRIFKLAEGIRYIPDFYLPKNDLWVEIKDTPQQELPRKTEMFKKLGLGNIVAISYSEFDQLLNS